MLARTALLFLLAGCGGEPKAFVHVHDPCEPLALVPAADATDQQRASVRDAIDMWNAVAATQLTLEPTLDSLPIVFEDSDLYLGYYDDEAQVVRLARRVNEQRAMAVVLAHELGHSFDLYHVKGRDSVMNTGNWEIAPLATDAQDLEAVWGLCVHR